MVEPSALPAFERFDCELNGSIDLKRDWIGIPRAPYPNDDSDKYKIELDKNRSSTTIVEKRIGLGLDVGGHRATQLQWSQAYDFE